MANSLIDQIDAELQSIRQKLAGPSDIGALVAVLVANIATSKTVADTLAAQIVTSDAVIDTLTTNVATSKTVVDLLYDSADAGTGLGPKASIEGTDDLTEFFVAAIALETP